MKKALVLLFASLLLGACNDEKKPANDQTTVKVLQTPADVDGGAAQAQPSGGW